jgi:crossover junction endodeoxyribonuclease RuvC
MAIIIGIDPGSRVTGYGVIERQGSTLRHISSGHIKVGKLELPERLKSITSGIVKIVQEFRPEEAGIERVFVSKNVNSALKLGQARGAAIVALAEYGLKVFEYAPRQIKLAVVGYGGADKNQIQRMVKMLLKLDYLPQTDIADALAIAICHAHTRRI